MRDLPFGNVTGNGAFRPGLAVCPTCEQVIDNARAEEIREKYEARERELEEKYAHRFETKMRKIEAESLAKGIETGKAVAAADTKFLTEQLAEQKARADGLEADFDARVKDGVEAYCSQKDLQQARKDADHASEIAKITKKLLEANAIIEKQNAQKKGDDAELDIVFALKRAFPFDKVERISKGVHGYDVHHTVMNLGKPVCTFAHESKNTGRWMRDYSAKFRQDQLKAEAVYGVLWTTTMPTGAEADITQVDEVFVCKHRLGVEVTRMLRQACIKISLIENDDDRDQAQQELFDYMTTGQGYDRLVTLIGLSEKEAKIDADDDRDHAKHMKARARIRAQRDGLLSDIMGEIDGINGGD